MWPSAFSMCWIPSACCSTPLSLTLSPSGRGDSTALCPGDAVAHESAFPGPGPPVDGADAGEPLAVGGRVVVAKEVVAATHGEHAGAACDRALECGLLGLDEVFVHERLLAILAAAEKEDIDVVHALGGAAPQLDESGVEVAPFGSLEQREDVAAIPVDVHEVGVQPTDGERFPGHCDYVSQ